MAHEHDRLAPISFVYEYARHGWAKAWISDGVDTYCMQPSYVSGDPLSDLVHAIVEVLRYGGEAQCVWFYEPAEDCWILRREGNTLEIVIRGVDGGLSCQSCPSERGELKISMICDVWRFAAKVRLTASRMTLSEERYRNPAAVKQTPEYQVLCAFLEDHKGTGTRTLDKKQSKHQE